MATPTNSTVRMALSAPSAPPTTEQDQGVRDSAAFMVGLVASDCPSLPSVASAPVLVVEVSAVPVLEGMEGVSPVLVGSLVML